MSHLGAVLVILQDAFSINVRNASSTKLPLRQLEHLANMLAWHDQDVLVRITGEALDMEMQMKVVGESRESLDRRIGVAIGNLQNLAFRFSHAEIRLSLSEALAKYYEFMFYHEVLFDGQMNLQAHLSSPGFEFANLTNMLGFVYV